VKKKQKYCLEVAISGCSVFSKVIPYKVLNHQAVMKQQLNEMAVLVE